MSNYNVSAINSYNNSYYNNYYKNNSSNLNFDTILNNMPNVPTGRSSSSNSSSANNYCAVHNNQSVSNISSNGNNLNSSTLSNITSNNNNSSDSLRDIQTKKAIEIAKSYVGGKYVWGATGPNAFDCSGFTQYIYKQAYGKSIPRVSYDQANYGQKIDKKDLQPGDLIFFDTMNKGRVSHVGIYIGNNKFIHAANSKSGIIESSLSGYYERKYLGARRP